VDLLPRGKIDWIANLDFRQLRDAQSGRGFHSGFQGAYSSFDKTIRDFVRRKNPERVWITGHSLGGGMAACCAYALLKEKLPITGVVTFGQPRVGNEAVAQYLDTQLGDRYLRVMNEGDPVPILPPSIGRRMPAYWHPGRRVWFIGGQLLTTEGPTVYSQTGPEDEDDNDDEENYLDETTGDDLTASITEEDFLELQRQMKAVPADELLPPEDTAVYGAAAPGASRAIFDGVLGFFRSRIGEHYMDSYLTRLRGHVERQK
jgi:pimeloyl-ACP methyl ester carboxylesterase